MDPAFPSTVRSEEQWRGCFQASRRPGRQNKQIKPADTSACKQPAAVPEPTQLTRRSRNRNHPRPLRKATPGKAGNQVEGPRGRGGGVAAPRANPPCCFQRHRRVHVGMCRMFGKSGPALHSRITEGEFSVFRSVRDLHISRTEAQLKLNVLLKLLCWVGPSRAAGGPSPWGGGCL